MEGHGPGEELFRVYVKSSASVVFPNTRRVGWGRDPKQQVIYICLFLAIPTELKNVYIHDCCVPNVTSPPPSNSFVEILIPDVRALRAGAFGRCSKHEGGALVHGIGVLPISVQRAP